MAVPGINNPRRFEIEWRQSPNRADVDRHEFIAGRWRHVLADFDAAKSRYDALSKEQRKEAGLFQKMFLGERLRGDQRRQILGEIPVVDMFWTDRSFFGGAF